MTPPMTDLKALSEAATGGEWTVLGSGRDCWVDEWNYGYDGEVPQADIEYTCRLSNDYRAGELVEAGKLRELVKEWRGQAKGAFAKSSGRGNLNSDGYFKEGRADGLEDAADALAAIIGEGE